MKRGRVKYDLIQTICHSFCHPLGGEKIKIILKNEKHHILVYELNLHSHCSALVEVMNKVKDHQDAIIFVCFSFSVWVVWGQTFQSKAYLSFNQCMFIAFFTHECRLY